MSNIILEIIFTPINTHSEAVMGVKGSFQSIFLPNQRSYSSCFITSNKWQSFKFSHHLKENFLLYNIREVVDTQLQVILGLWRNWQKGQHHSRVVWGEMMTSWVTKKLHYSGVSEILKKTNSFVSLSQGKSVQIPVSHIIYICHQWGHIRALNCTNTVHHRVPVILVKETWKRYA